MRAQTAVAVLFARRRSIYFDLPGCDVYDEARDVRNFVGGLPVVAHPPCRSWGRLRGLANPVAGEREATPVHLARWLVEVARRSSVRELVA